MLACRTGVQPQDVSSRPAGPTRYVTGSCIEQPAAAHGSLTHRMQLLAFIAGAYTTAPAGLMQLGLRAWPHPTSAMH